MDESTIDLIVLMKSLPPIKITNINRYGVVTEYEEDHFGKKQGRFTEKNHHGNLISESFYRDDVLHGTHTRWDYDYIAHKRAARDSPVTAVMRERTNYTGGILDGLYEKFYDNGAPNKRMTYMSGKLTGRIQVWDKEGNVIEDWEYPADL